MTEHTLEAQALSCARGTRSLFRALSLKLTSGQGLYISGENGAGKTSLLRILCGLLLPTEGQVLWNGTPIQKQREAFGQALIYVGHLNGIKDDLTAAENMRFSLAAAGHTATDAQIHQALHTFGIGGRTDLPARVLSQGQKRRVALARLLLAQAAPLWILDEPYTALDTTGVSILSDTIETQLARGGIVILTTHQTVTLPAAITQLEISVCNEGRA